MIVYRNALLRDYIALALTDGGVVVVGAIPVVELEDSPLQTLDPDVVVFEDATAEFVQAACRAIDFRPASSGVKKLIVIGRECLITIVYQKEIVEDASLEDLVCRIRDGGAPIGG
jgi:hypothetical protein